MNYDDDYGNQDWEDDLEAKSYDEDDVKQLSDYQSSSQDQKQLQKTKQDENSSEDQNDELQSTTSKQQLSTMIIDMIPEKKKQELGIQDQFLTQAKVPVSERITSPFITKYQKAILIGKRAQQISKNSAIYIEISQDELKKSTALDIAEMQFQMCLIPMIIRRFLPDNTYEDWKLSDLKKLPY